MTLTSPTTMFFTEQDSWNTKQPFFQWSDGPARDYDHMDVAPHPGQRADSAADSRHAAVAMRIRAFRSLFFMCTASPRPSQKGRMYS